MNGWLAGGPPKLPAVASPPASTLATCEKDVIEAALRESKGRVSGPFGAAARLGVPSSTLESKIKALQIDKQRFKSGWQRLPRHPVCLTVPMSVGATR